MRMTDTQTVLPKWARDIGLSITQAGERDSPCHGGWWIEYRVGGTLYWCAGWVKSLSKIRRFLAAEREYIEAKVAEIAANIAYHAGTRAEVRHERAREAQEASDRG